MKKLLLVLILLVKSHGSLAVLYDYYTQHSPIALYATDADARRITENLLDQFGLHYELIHAVNNVYYNDTLYIFAGDIKKCTPQTLPQHYIVYQTKHLPSISDIDLHILRNAAVVWDADWSNINRYKGQVSHWYYLPNDQYEFIDPVLLSCFLPLNALHVYKDLLVHSNNRDTDFSSHIPPLFCHCMLNNPGIVVESGIRGGDGSTIALAKVMQLLNNAYLIGLDIDDCSRYYAPIKNSYFFRMDDVQFPSYFKAHSFPKKVIDIVFIDTSHEYNHTLQEINAFNTVLAEQGAFVFHDSNVAIPHPVRINGTPCPSGVKDPKGVTNGLKTYFNISFDEGKYINTCVKGDDGYFWHLVNYPYCYGLAFAKRIKRIE